MPDPHGFRLALHLVYFGVNVLSRPPSPSFFFWFHHSISPDNRAKCRWRYFWLPINLRHQDYMFRLLAPNRAKLSRNQHHIMPFPSPRSHIDARSSRVLTCVIHLVYFGVNGLSRPPSPPFFFWFRLPISPDNRTKRCWRYFYLLYDLRS